jgi:hypothetical protein
VTEIEHPTREHPERWVVRPASTLQVKDVVYDPEVGSWLLNPEGNSRLAEVLNFVVPAEGSKDAELGMIVFWYRDINEPDWENWAAYLPDQGLQFWQ